MKPNRITLITLAVADLDRAQAYYEGLGWEASERTESIAFFDLDGQKLALYLKSSLENDIGVKIGAGTGAMTLAQNFASPAMVDEAHARALAQGAVEVTKPEAVFWGGYSGYHKDPDGHLWEYAHNPFWELDEDGRLKAG